MVAIRELDFLTRYLIPALVDFAYVANSDLIVARDVGMALSLTGRLLAALGRSALGYSIVRYDREDLYYNAILCRVVRVLCDLDLIVVSGYALYDYRMGFEGASG